VDANVEDDVEVEEDVRVKMAEEATVCRLGVAIG
jgi:hypothetical protein